MKKQTVNQALISLQVIPPSLNVIQPVASYPESEAIRRSAWLNRAHEP